LNTPRRVLSKRAVGLNRWGDRVKAIRSLLVLFLVSADFGVAVAQESGKTYRIGYLGNGSPVTSGRYAEGFIDALRGLGFVEGKNTVITYRWAEGNFDRLPALAGELVRDKPDVIVGLGGALVAAAIKSATSTLPSVILTDDPVAEGLVASLARPGGNLTGVSVLQEKAELKRVQLLKDTLPHAARIAILRNPSRPNSAVQLDAAKKAASSLGLEVTTWDASSTEELGRLLSTVSVASIDAVLALTDPMLSLQRERIVRSVLRWRNARHRPRFGTH
jgi:putative ABC transport system substrate-binding protein